MTKYALIICFALLLLTFLSCTRNDGGEAQLYGQWKLQRVERDGVTDDSYAGDIFWKFQNKTIEMQQMLPLHENVATFGNYRLSDGTLYLSFPDEQYPPLLSLPRQCELRVVRLKGGEMVLATGEPATMFYFKRW